MSGLITPHGDTNGQAGLLSRLVLWLRAAETAEPAALAAAPVAPQPVIVEPPKPTLVDPASIAAPEAIPGLAEVLSPSQTSKYTGCSAAWMFRYFRNLPDPPNANRALGSAFHKAMAANFRQKIQSKVDLSREEILDLYAQAWDIQSSQAVFAADDDPAELERVGAVLAQKFLLEAAPEIQPAAVELPVSGIIGGVPVRGYVDLLDTDGRIVEFKTAAKKPSPVDASHALQLAVYRQITPGASGHARLYTIAKTKVPAIYQQKYEVSAADIRHAEIMLPLVQAGMRSGLYCPNRQYMYCSRSGCSFWRECEQEFGGTVED